MKRKLSALGIYLASLGLVACSESEDEGSGTLSVLLESEDTIIDGLDPGDRTENIRDGWRVRYDKYIVAVGDIDVHFSSDENVEAHDESVFAVDLMAVPATGEPFWELAGLRAGRWEFGYETAGAAHGATRHDSVSESDFERMQQEDATYLIEGVLEKIDGQSCPPRDPDQSCYDNPSISFNFLVSAETVFGPCELDGIPGFSISDGATQTVAVTIHGDHLFFNGFPEGDEGGVLRLAQWLADCDLDRDGQVTRAELESIDPSELSQIDSRYQLGGSPITPLHDMWDYVAAQLKTQGHMNGEGECPFDGMAHDH